MENAEEMPSCSCQEYFREGIICRHLFAVIKLLQIKDVSSYIHKRWLIQEETSYEKHKFDDNWKKATRVADRFREKKEQNEMEGELSFSQTIQSMKTKKQSQESEEDEEEEELEEENESFQSEESFIEISASKEGKKKVANFKKKTSNKGRPKETHSSKKNQNLKPDKRRKTLEGERIENLNQTKNLNQVIKDYIYLTIRILL